MIRATPLRRLLALAFVALAAVACTAEPFSLSASGPFAYPAPLDVALERVAILVTIANHAEEDLQVSPGDFAARDAERRIYTANLAATVADARLVRNAIGPRREVLPLPLVTLRKDDVLSGFVVFDVPAGVRPVELILRQTDTDRVVELAPPQ